MSSYTYVILTCSHIDEIGEHGMRMLLPALEERGLPSFARGKQGEGVVYTLCGNYLPFTDLIKAIESVPWERPEQVQLFQKHESADRYEEVGLRLKRLVREFYIEWAPDKDGAEFDEFSQTRGQWRTGSHTEVREPE